MPNTAPIAIQLYTVRDLLAEDFAGTVRQIADIGYAGVEPFGVPDNVTQAAALFDELGLAVPSAHLPLPIGEDKERVLDVAAAYDLDYIVSGCGPEDFATPAGIKHTCALCNEAQRVAAEHGYAFGIHNHWWEFEQVDGEYVYHVMLEHLDPAITFEIDVYWVQAAGLDPAGVIRELGDRVRLLHVKDGPAVRDEPMVAVGDGDVDIPGVIRAGAESVEWLIVELDECATDMLTAVERSYAYLVAEGLGRGRGG